MYACIYIIVWKGRVAILIFYGLNELIIEWNNGYDDLTIYIIYTQLFIFLFYIFREVKRDKKGDFLYTYIYKTYT